jgi:hypothetical protein
LSEVFLTGGLLLPARTRQLIVRETESGSLSPCGFLQSSPAAPQPLWPKVDLKEGLDEDDIGEEFGTSKKSFAQRLPTVEKAESGTK